jgi:hypothetical protein
MTSYDNYGGAFEEGGSNVTTSSKSSVETVRVEVKRLNTRILHDQQSGLAARDGCLSNPNGPAC